MAFGIEYKVHYRSEDNSDWDGMDFPTWREIKKLLNSVKIGDDIGIGFIEKCYVDHYNGEAGDWDYIVLLTTDENNKVNGFVTWDDAKANKGLNEDKSLGGTVGFSV